MLYRTVGNSEYVRLRRERRSVHQINEFPLEDLNGNLIFEERRIIPDRRVEGLEVTESEISLAKFKEYLDDYQKSE